MAIRPVIKYAGQVYGSDTAYPHGRAQNISAVLAGDGTPWEKDLVNDLFGFQQALLSAGGVAPSGSPDNIFASDYVTAIKNLIATAQAAATVASEQNVQAQNWPERPVVNTSGASTINVRVPICWTNNNGLAFNNGGLYCALDSGGAGTRSYTSEDGNAWTRASSAIGTLGSPVDVAAGVVGGVPAFLCGDTSSQLMKSSTDGLNWSTSGSLAADHAAAIAYAPSLNLWVVATDNGTIYTSSNGSTWTLRTVPGGWAGIPAGRLVWNGSTFVLTGDSFSALTSVLTSTDGLAWNLRTVPSAQYKGLAYSAADSVWIAGGKGREVSRSFDNGVTWSAASLALAAFSDLAVLGTLWVGATDGGANGGIQYSVNKGVSWKSVSVGIHNSTFGAQMFSRIIAADARFVATHSSATALEFALSLRAG